VVPADANRGIACAMPTTHRSVKWPSRSRVAGPFSKMRAAFPMAVTFLVGHEDGPVVGRDSGGSRGGFGNGNP